jgi:quercetin dioxygenase-like cupin family protein
VAPTLSLGGALLDRADCNWSNDHPSAQHEWRVSRWTSARIDGGGDLSDGGQYLSRLFLVHAESTMSLYFPTTNERSTHTIFPGVTIQTCAADKMMMSYVELAPRSVVDEHSHPHEQVGMVLEGRVRFYIGGEEKVLGKGDMFRIPGNVKHHVTTLEEPARVLDIFYPIREDYR